MLKATNDVSTWKADREALKRDVLTSLNAEGRSLEELLLLYEAAQATFRAWAPPELDGAEALNSPWSRESERAFIAMEAIAERLVETWPDTLAERHLVLALLADWHACCDDNPKIIAAIVKLLADSKHFRKAVAS